MVCWCQLGARTFLYYEYRALAVVVSIVYVLFSAAISWQTGICYLAGAFSSMMAGYIGMMTTTMANSRTTKAAEKDLNTALRVAFNAGAVMVCCTPSPHTLALRAPQSRPQRATISLEALEVLEADARDDVL